MNPPKDEALHGKFSGNTNSLGMAAFTIFLRENSGGMMGAETPLFLPQPLRTHAEAEVIARKGAAPQPPIAAVLVGAGRVECDLGGREVARSVDFEKLEKRDGGQR